MPNDKYCYPGSNILINKLNITDKKELYDTEVEMTLLRHKELQERPIKGNFDFEHLKRIHQYIFRICMIGPGKSGR